MMVKETSPPMTRHAAPAARVNLNFFCGEGFEDSLSITVQKKTVENGSRESGASLAKM